MNKMSAPDFDTWLDFYNLNEEWVQKSIFFRESRFPFNIDDTLKMLGQKADTLKRDGMWTAFEGPMLVHVGIVLKFRMVEAELPLLSHRIQVLNSLIAANKNQDLGQLIESQKSELKVSEKEKLHVRHYLILAKEWCDTTGASYQRFCEIHSTILMCLLNRE